MLVDALALAKDGPGLCIQFGDIIDQIEAKYEVIVVYFVTDADGGSLKARKLLAIARPWLFLPSCWAHQVCRLCSCATLC